MRFTEWQWKVFSVSAFLSLKLSQWLNGIKTKCNRPYLRWQTGDQKERGTSLRSHLLPDHKMMAPIISELPVCGKTTKQSIRKKYPNHNVVIKYYKQNNRFKICLTCITGFICVHIFVITQPLFPFKKPPLCCLFKSTHFTEESLLFKCSKGRIKAGCFVHLILKPNGLLVLNGHTWGVWKACLHILCPFCFALPDRWLSKKIWVRLTTKNWHDANVQSSF